MRKAYTHFLQQAEGMTLKQIIIERIKTKCPISFETYMEMCLYYPQLGYYTNNSTKIGRAGDFYTSPHLHPIFGAMFGRQMEEMWNLMGKPDLFHVVEMGAGMGYLAKDVLGYLQQSGKEKDVLRHLKYTIVELNPSIKARQEELLSGYIDKVNWVSDLKDMEPIAGCFLSNELLDAFPVRVVETNDELMEIYVDVKGDELIEVTMPCMEEAKEYFKEFSVELPDGFRTEVNIRIKDWLRGVSEKLSEGFVLTVDYGYPAWDYYSEERSRGTLLCYHGHQVNENPYQNVGEQDITAHVNFSALKKWGEETGMKTLGFCPQGTYLVSLGIDEVIPELYGDSSDGFEIAKIKGLFLPEGMGESHKVMVQYKGEKDIKLKGFNLRNQIKIL